MLNLIKKILHINNRRCNHEYPSIVIVADLVDREGKFLRTYFCMECNDYRYKKIDHEEGDHPFFSKIKEQGYYVYCPSGELPANNGFWEKYI